MYIKEGTIAGYTWEVWYNGSCLHDDEEIFDTEEEATFYAKEFCKDRLVQWESDGVELDGSELEELIAGIVVEEIVEECEDDENF